MSPVSQLDMISFNLWMRRYGLTMSIVASRDLVAGEEVFVSYNYALEKAPEWYQVCSCWLTSCFAKLKLNMPPQMSNHYPNTPSLTMKSF